MMLHTTYVMSTSTKNPLRIQNSLTLVFTLLDLSVGQIVRGRIRCILRRTDPDGHSDLRVVEVERRRLGTDARDRGEVVPRRRAGRRPLERAAVAPRVVHCDP